LGKGGKDGGVLPQLDEGIADKRRDRKNPRLRHEIGEFAAKRALKQQRASHRSEGGGGERSRLEKKRTAVELTPAGPPGLEDPPREADWGRSLKKLVLRKVENTNESAEVPEEKKVRARARPRRRKKEERAPRSKKSSAERGRSKGRDDRGGTRRTPKKGTAITLMKQVEAEKSTPGGYELRSRARGGTNAIPGRKNGAKQKENKGW